MRRLRWISICGASVLMAGECHADWSWFWPRAAAPVQPAMTQPLFTQPVLTQYAPAVPSTQAVVPAAAPAEQPTIVGYAPVAYAPVAYAPITYQPQTQYRTSWERVPVTVYRPIVTTDATTGQAVTSLSPCVSYTWQARRVPVATYYRPVSAPQWTAPLTLTVPTTTAVTAPNVTLPTAAPATAPYYGPAQAAPGYGLVPSNMVPGTAVPGATFPGAPPSAAAPSTVVPGAGVPGATLVPAGQPADQAPALAPGSVPRTILNYPPAQPAPGATIIPSHPTSPVPPAHPPTSSMVPVPAFGTNPAPVGTGPRVEAPVPHAAAPPAAAPGNFAPVNPAPPLIPAPASPSGVRAVAPAVEVPQGKTARPIPDPDAPRDDSGKGLFKFQVPKLFNPRDRTANASTPRAALVAAPAVAPAVAAIAGANEPAATAVTPPARVDSVDDAGWTSVRRDR